jgi:hypothetical protein
MSEEPRIAALDVAGIERWLDNPAVSVAEVMAELPFLRIEAEAEEFLASIRSGLEDIRLGRTVPHEQVVRDMQERRRRYRASAAE